MAPASPLLILVHSDQPFLPINNLAKPGALPYLDRALGVDKKVRYHGRSTTNYFR